MIKTYVPLYRKYRPQTFKDLVGQDAISKTLSNAIFHNRVAHAYLFTGPRGTGKTSAARILAKSLNCEQGPTDNPCGVCSACVDITNGTALDVVEIDAASNRSVQNARDLIERVQYASVSGRYKVYIIDEVHMLSNEAFNALLKTIEEPPANLVFILATTEAHKVLETIISRCQRFDFRRISQVAIVNRLRHIAEVENIKITKESLNLIARRSAGGLRDALGLLDQISVLSSVGEEIQVKDVLSLIGALPEDMLVKISDGIVRCDGAYTLEIINKLLSYGSEPLQIVKELTIHFRNLLITSTIKDNLDDIIDASEEFYDDLRNISAGFKQIELAQIIDKLSYTERMIRYTTQPILWLEVGVLSICYRQDITLIDDLQKRVEELESALASGSVSISTSRPYQPKQAAQSYKPVSTPVKAIKKEEPEQKQPKPVIKEEVVKYTEPLVEIKSEILKVEEIEPEKVIELDHAPVPEVIQEKPEPIKEPAIETPVTVEVSKEPVVSESYNTADFESTWKVIVNAIKSPPTRGLLSSLAVPMAVSSHDVVIGFTQEFFLEDIKNPRKCKFLEEALIEVFGALPNLQFKLISEKQSESVKKKSLEAVKSNEQVETANPVTYSKSQNDVSSVESTHSTVDVMPMPKEDPGEKLHRLETMVENEDSNDLDFSHMDLIEEVLEPEQPEITEQTKLFIDTFQGKVIKNAE